MDINIIKISKFSIIYIKVIYIINVKVNTKGLIF